MSGRAVRIARVIARLNVGGPARHVVWLSEAMNGGEFETALITGVVPPGEEDMSAFATQRGVTPFVIPEMSREISPRDAITVVKLFRFFRRFRPDIIHTHTAKAGAAGRTAGFLYRWLTPGTLIGRPRRVRFVHTFHGHIFHSYYGKLKTRVFLLIEKTLARLTDAIVVLSEQQRHEIHDVFGVGRREQFRVVPLGIDLAESDAARRDADDVVVALAGRLTAIKNIDLFLRVANLLLPSPRGEGARSADEGSNLLLPSTRGEGARTADEGSPHPAFGHPLPARRGEGRGLRFVIYGDGSDRAALEARAAELGVADRVVFAGTRPAREIYASIDIAALTSLNEGTPLTLIEAMANGLPAISTAVGGVVDVLGNVEERVTEGDAAYEIRERGITAASNDERGFAAGLRRLLADDALRARLGQRGRAFAHAVYSKERLIADIIRLYRELQHPPH